MQFVRLAFCDLFGTHKNLSIMPEELPTAFENGVSFDANAVRGFGDVTRSDLLLYPEPDTLTVLPWRPGPGRVVRLYCSIKNPDGSTFVGDSRFILKQVVAHCEQMGYVCKIGAECEFYLFKTNENGEPVDAPLDNGGYFDIAPLDKGENIRREICLCLKEMGIRPEASHHEQGPGQNEIDFQFDDALACADNLQTFKSVVKAIAARNGLFASFMPKPIRATAGSGMHINLSLNRNGTNIFKNASDEHTVVMESFIAGILDKTPEITLFLNPIANSYERLGCFEAPKYVSWSSHNRSQLIRIPAATGERARLELRSPDPSLNPYLAFALILMAGLDGIKNGRKLPPAVNADLYTADSGVTSVLTPLPDCLEKAIELARMSKLVKEVMGVEMLARYADEKGREAAEYSAAEDKMDFFRARYFPFL